MRFKGLTVAVVCLAALSARAEVINGVAGQSVTAIPNGSLVNSSVTINGACGLTSPGALALGAAATIQRQIVVNAQTGTSYTVLSGDCGKLVTLSNASAIAVTLPQATGSFTTGWSAFLQNLGAGTVTITPTTSTINGTATLVLTTGQSALVVSDGTNYTATTISGINSVVPNANLANSQITLNGACGLTSPGATSLGATATMQGQTVVNAQTGPSYTVLSGDCGKLVTLSNAAAIAVTLPQATGSFTTGWYAFVQNLGAGAVTITPTTSTINGVATLKLTSGQSARIVSDGTNYTATTIAGLDSKSNLTGNYTATPTNAVQRTLASRLADTHPITDWGAKGDGSTDNCTALTNAFADAITGTFNLRMPGGIFLTSCAITLGSSSVSVSLRGEGEDNSIIRATGAFPAATPLLTSAGHNSIIEGVQLDGNSLAQTGIDLNAAFHFYVDHVQVTNPTLDGLKCEGGGAEVYVANSRFYLTSGVATPASSAGIRFAGCTDSRAEGNTTIGFEKGVVSTSNNNRFTSNHLWAAPFAAGTPNTGNGWLTIGIDDSSTNGATIIGNEIDTPQVNCIKSSGFNARILGNYCFNSTTYGTDNSLVGILLTQSGPFATVDSNYFYGGDVTHRFANDISVTGNLNFWNNLTSQVVTTHANAMSGRVVFGGGTTTQSAVDNATAELSVVGSVAATGDYAVSNPGNTSALLGMDWNSNIARLRIAGSGTGSANGFQIQTGSNRSILTLDDNGLMTIPGNGAGSGGFLTPLKVLASGMTSAGNHTQVLIGVDTANSGGNAASVMLTYAGAGSASNYASFGLGSVVSPFNVFASGKVTINTTTDNGSDALQVNGNILGSLFKFADSTSIRSGSDGNIQLTNNGNGGFTCLQLGPVDTSHAALCQTGTTLQARLADNSADTAISALAFNGQLNLGSLPATFDRTNASTGTATGSLVKQIDTAGAPQIAKTGITDTNAIGVVVSGAGTSGTAKVATMGIVSCLFDNVAVTDNDYVVISTATVGTCSDAGATRPSGVQIIGLASGSHTACGSAPCGPWQILINTDVVGASGSGIQASPSSAQTLQATTDVTGLAVKQSNTTNTADIFSIQNKSAVKELSVNSAGNIDNAWWLPNGTNAVRQNIISRLQAEIWVDDFGADPTGSADSTTAFTRAVTYACSLSPAGMIRMGKGTYKIVSRIDLNCDGVGLKGMGHNNTIINFANTATQTAIRVISAAGNVEVYDNYLGQFDMQSSTNFQKTGIQMSDAGSSIVENIHMYPWTSNGAAVASIPFETLGRDNNIYRDLEFHADAGIHIGVDPNIASETLDNTVFQNIYIIVNSPNNACYLVDPAAALTQVHLIGPQPCVQSNWGFFFDASASVATSNSLTIDDLRPEQATVSTATVNTAVTTKIVTYTGGSQVSFDTKNPPPSVKINGVHYPVASVTDSTHLVLKIDPGTQTGVTMTNDGWAAWVAGTPNLMQNINLGRAGQGGDTSANGNGFYIRNGVNVTLGPYWFNYTGVCFDLASSDSQIHFAGLTCNGAGSVSNAATSYDGTYFLNGKQYTQTKTLMTGVSANADLAGTVTLSGGTGTYTFSSLSNFTSAPICVATDTTAANAVKTSTTTTVLTLTGTTTDVIAYHCIGRN